MSKAHISSGLSGARVAILNFREPLQSVAGGAEEYAWRVARHLGARGAQVWFVTAREPDQPRSEVRHGVTLRRMGNRYTLYPLAALWLLLRRRRLDLVVDCMNGIPFFAPAVLPRRTPVISLIHHVHDRQFLAFFPPWLARIGCFVEGPVARRLYRRCRTVTVSESSMRDLRERLGWTAPIQVIPNGGATVAEGVRPDPALGEPALVFLGRLVGHKRVARVVELADLLADRWPGLRVHVIGRGPEFEPLAQMVEARRLSGKVTLHGHLPEEAKIRLLGAATLHVTASEFEGWGLTVIEAAALGVPTVAYGVAGLRDSVRDGVTGWLAAEGEHLADVVDRALKELSEPPARAEIGAACRAWAGEFSWERTVTLMAALVESELAARFAPAIVPESRVSPEIS
ncbi:glycosyltransferase family 4 protein [Acrocarpospora sp. B8E8]|uniref:glycosyltransferase family 4 protein n=1 Tax=Acrocarpospora sp. B8E8 TaxID=3153572 RepID=UPI00325F1E6D